MNNIESILIKLRKEKENNSGLNFELGKEYFINKNYSEAEKYLKKVLDIDEFKVNALDLLSKTYKLTNQIDKLIESYKKILEINNILPYVYEDLIDIYLCSGKKYYIILDYIKRVLDIGTNDVYLNIVKLKVYSLLGYNKNIINEKLQKLFASFIQNKYKIIEFFKLAYFFAIEKNIDLSINIIGYVKDFEILKEEIHKFFISFQYDFAVYIKMLRLSNVDVENKLNSILEQIPNYLIKPINIIENELEIYQKKVILKSKPRAITVVLTNRCNLKCKMCDVWKNIWDMSNQNIDEIKKIMPYLEYVTWHGGEVFLHRRFLELLDFAQKCGIQQEVITNGLLMNEDIIKKFVDYNIQLTISIDGINKETYEKIRIGSNFDKLISVLDNLNSYRKIKKESAFKIRMNTIISEDNYLDIFSFIEFAHKYNIKELYLFPLIFDLTKYVGLQSFIDAYTSVVEYIEQNRNKIFELARKFDINIINTLPTLQIFNEKVKKNFNNNNDLHVDEQGCSKLIKNEEMIEYNKEINHNIKRQIICAVPWQRLRLDSVIRPHCFCKGNANIDIMNDSFDIHELWNCKNIQAYRKMIVNEDFRCYCNPSCYLGFVPENQYNGVV